MPHAFSYVVVRSLFGQVLHLHMPGSSAIYMSLFYRGSSYYINPYELSTKPNAPFEKLSFNDIYSSEKACLIKL